MTRKLTLNYLKTFSKLLNKNTEFEKLKMTGSFLFKVKDGPTYLMSLAGGKVTGVRDAAEEDDAFFIAEANQETWSDLLEGTVDPIITRAHGDLYLTCKGTFAQRYNKPFYQMLYLLSAAPPTDA